MVALAAYVVTAVLSLPGDSDPNQLGPCTKPECYKPKKAHERIMNTQPGYQWGDAGGYCGSFATQRAAMAKGAWISQQQVRDHTSHGAPGSHDEEILDTNIKRAWTNLKFTFEAFDYKHEATPQLDAIRSFVKKQLSAGHVVVMMIQKKGHQFPIYGMTPPSGFYDHVVPFVGVLSDKPLVNESSSADGFDDDDYIVHYTDHSVYPYYRSMKSLVGAYDRYSSCPSTSGDPQYVCINPTYGYGWALTGFADDADEDGPGASHVPLSLTVDPWQEEPDTRRGQSPVPLTGTLHIEGLTSGSKYAIYRWDSVEAAFDYTRPTSVHRFTASSATQQYTDPKTFMSNGTTYYRCVADKKTAVEAKASAPFGKVVTLNNGVSMPSINLGTCCGSKPSVGLEPWLAAGGVGIDTAWDYHDQSDIKTIIASKPRSSYFVTTKLPAGFGNASDCDADSSIPLSYVKENLAELGLAFVDLILLHAPCRYQHPLDGAKRDKALWSGMQALLSANLSRAIGVSNYNSKDLEAIKGIGVTPAVNQCRMNLKQHDDTTIAYCHQNGIVYEGYDVMKGCPFSDASVTSIAASHKVSAAQICLRWMLEKRTIMATGTGANASRVKAYAEEDLDIYSFQLTAEEVATLDKIGASE